MFKIKEFKWGYKIGTAIKGPLSFRISNGSLSLDEIKLHQRMIAKTLHAPTRMKQSSI